MTEEVFIGIDLGGTLVRAGRFNKYLELEARSETHTRSEDGGPEAVIARMGEQARAVWPTNGATVSGIGISAPGPINPKTGVVTTPPNLKGWHNVPLRDWLQQKVDVPTYLGNDANLAALAESAMGAARGYTDVVFLTISTGIGSGIIVAGKLLIGSEGIGDECGHMIMLVDGERVSSLEKEAAGPAIGRQARAAVEAGEKSSILELAGGSLEAIDARIVGEAAKAGDALGVRLVERAGKIIGLGVVSLLHIFNPQIVVIGGGVAKGMGELLFTPLRKTVEQYSLDSTYWQNLIIAPAELGENVSLIGAAALARARGEVS